MNICIVTEKRRDTPENMSIGSLGERVDLNLGGILVLEDPVQVDENIGGFALRRLVLEAQLLGDTQCRGLVKSLLEIDWGGDDGVRVLGSNLFNVHSALRRRNNNGATSTTIVQDSNVVFMRGIPTLCKHDLANSHKINSWPHS